MADVRDIKRLRFILLFLFYIVFILPNLIHLARVFRVPSTLSRFCGTGKRLDPSSETDGRRPIRDSHYVYFRAYVYTIIIQIRTSNDYEKNDYINHDFFLLCTTYGEHLVYKFSCIPTEPNKLCSHKFQY